MAFRSYRRKRRFSRRRVRSFGKTKRLLSRIKKDVLKNNFPTKIKLIGLPEYKKMYLQYQEVLEATPAGKQLILYPTRTENISSVVETVELDGGVAARIGNWDKMAILDVMIRVQPIANMFDGTAGKTINTVSCFYAMNNNVPLPNSIGSITDQAAAAYDITSLPLKPLFKFNSNEAFTFVLHGPSTMLTNSPAIYKRGTWWSLADQQVFGTTSAWTEELKTVHANKVPDFLCPVSGVINSPFTASGIAPAVHCGRLFFCVPENTPSCSFNVSVSYKVALKG